MSKSRVFIIWNDKDIANKVSEKLVQYQYEGIVGGSEGAAGGRTIIDTVINGMVQCDQAIAIMKKTDDDKQISANVFLELGYAISKYGNMRTHMYFIDYDYKDVPGDLGGVWVDGSIKSSEIKPTFAPANWSVFEQIDKIVDTLPIEKTMRKAVKEGYKTELWRVKNINEIAEEIVKSFIAHQKTVIPEDKIKVLANYYHYRNYVIDHMISPHCSDYELAQYIIFLTQGAYIHDDLEDFKRYLEELHVNGHYSPELDMSVQYALASVEVFQAVMPNEYVKMSGRNTKNYINKTVKLLEQLLPQFSKETSLDKDKEKNKGKEDDEEYNRFHINKNTYDSARRKFEDIRLIVEESLDEKIRQFQQEKDGRVVDSIALVYCKEPMLYITSNYPENVYDDFWLWMYASVFEMEQYLEMLYLYSIPAEEKDRRQEIYDLMKKAARSCRILTHILYYEAKGTAEEEGKKYHEQNTHNKFFAKLYQAYVYRNLYEASKFISKDERSTDTDEEKNLEKALRLREELLLYCKNNIVTDMFEKQMDMEYYLALSRALDIVTPRPVFDYDSFYRFFNSSMISLSRKIYYIGGMNKILKYIQVQDQADT